MIVCRGGVFPCRPKFLVKACLYLASGKIVMHFSCDAKATPRTWSFLIELAAFYALFMAQALWEARGNQLLIYSSQQPPEVAGHQATFRRRSSMFTWRRQRVRPQPLPPASSARTSPRKEVPVPFPSGRNGDLLSLASAAGDFSACPFLDAGFRSWRLSWR